MQSLKSTALGVDEQLLKIRGLPISADERIALIERVKVKAARESFHEFRRYIHPKNAVGWFQKDAAEHLQQFYEDLKDGKRPKLVIEAPPQHGKSMLVVDFIAWLSGKRPDNRTIYTSFSERLGIRANLSMQRMMGGSRYKSVFPDFGIPEKNAITISAQKLRNRDIIEFLDSDGYFRNTTVQGSITGESLDCVDGETLIHTINGVFPIKTLKAKDSPVKVLSLDTTNGELSYEEISHFKRIKKRGVYRITDNDGRVLECTGDHRIFTANRGYIEACNVSAGDSLLCALREDVHQTGLRRGEMAEVELPNDVLLERMPKQKRPHSEGSKKVLQGLRKRNTEAVGCVVRGLFDGNKGREDGGVPADRDAVPTMREDISVRASRAWKIRLVLFDGLQKFQSLFFNDERKKPLMARRDNGGEGEQRSEGEVQSREEAIHGEVRGRMRRPVPDVRLGNAHSVPPQGFRPHIKHGGEFSGSVRAVPCCNTQQTQVAKIELIDEERVFYDITVNKNHNFFANGILVHNCGVIDDPIRGRKDANSTTVRNGCWDWFTDDFFTRFSEDAGLLCILTRWHIDDPIGRLIASDPSVKVLKYKAIAEEDEPHRKKGEALFPELKSLEFLLERKHMMPDVNWSALFQQMPYAQGGEIIKGAMFGRYKKLPELLYRGIMSDTALKKKQANDYQVATCGGLGKDDGKVYIIDVFREKFEAYELEKRFPDFWAKHKTRDTGVLRYFGVEDKASGTELIQRMKNTIVPAIPVKAIPRSIDKYTRLQDVLGFIESGHVMLPENAPWVSDFIAECESFTADDAHDHDDQVDTLIDLIDEMLGGASGGSSLLIY